MADSPNFNASVTGNNTYTVLNGAWAWETIARNGIGSIFKAGQMNGLFVLWQGINPIFQLSSLRSFFGGKSVSKWLMIAILATLFVLPFFGFMKPPPVDNNKTIQTPAKTADGPKTTSYNGFETYDPSLPASYVATTTPAPTYTDATAVAVSASELPAAVALRNNKPTSFITLSENTPNTSRFDYKAAIADPAGYVANNGGRAQTFVVVNQKG